MQPKKKPDYFYNQSCVIPFRIEKDILKLLLISNRKRSRWIFPKGIIEQDLSPAESAKREAHEEAGIDGKVIPEIIGEYQYFKWGGTCTVKVFVMQIEKILKIWPESNFRFRIWTGIFEARRLINEKKLQKIIQNLPEIISNP